MQILTIETFLYTTHILHQQFSDILFFFFWKRYVSLLIQNVNNSREIHFYHLMNGKWRRIRNAIEWKISQADYCLTNEVVFYFGFDLFNKLHILNTLLIKVKNIYINSNPTVAKHSLKSYIKYFCYGFFVKIFHNSDIEYGKTKPKWQLINLMHLAEIILAVEINHACTFYKHVLRGKITVEIWRSDFFTFTCIKWIRWFNWGSRANSGKSNYFISKFH